MTCGLGWSFLSKSLIRGLLNPMERFPPATFGTRWTKRQMQEAVSKEREKGGLRCKGFFEREVNKVMFKHYLIDKPTLLLRAVCAALSCPLKTRRLVVRSRKSKIIGERRWENMSSFPKVYPKCRRLGWKRCLKTVGASRAQRREPHIPLLTGAQKVGIENA